MRDALSDPHRIVITGVGLAAPNGSSLSEFRESLLAGRSGVVNYETRYIGPVLAGVCDFDEFRYQKRKERRRGTRAGSVSIYCANEAVNDAGLVVGARQEGPRGCVPRDHRAWQCRDRERDLRDLPIRLRHQSLVASPQSAHGGKQSGRRGDAESGHHRAASDHRGRLRGPGTPDSFRPSKCFG